MNKDMGRVIRELREAAGLTQAELGDLVGIKGTMIYKYEAGISCVNIDMAFKLANALKIKPDIFVLKLMGFDKKEPAFQVIKHGRASQRALSPYTTILANTDIMLTKIAASAHYFGTLARARPDTVGRPDDPMVIEYLRGKGARQRDMFGADLLRAQSGNPGGH